MDQDTSNSPGKARWRERLGMGNSGNKEMPKLSDDFKPVSPPPPKSVPGRDARGQPASSQAHQAVTRPAPMAPRTPPQTGAPRPQQANATRPQPPAGGPRPPLPPASGVRPVAPVPQGASGLGDRLRAERQAAERLAEQRVAQARGKPLTPPQNLAPPPPKPAAPERPKFGFAPEELAKDKREAVPPPPPAPEREFPAYSSKASGNATPPPPLTPPRPALGSAGGQPQRQALPPKPQPSAPPPKPQMSAPPKPQAPLPAGPAFQPRYNGPPQQSAGGNYRSLDPPPGSLAPRPRPYADTAGSFREEPLARRDDPLARRPVTRDPGNREYDSYRRGPALPPQPAYNDETSFSDYRRRQQPVPARSRQPAYDEDVNEVFEDDEPQRPQRRRASAQDYNRAYRDYEDGYETDTPRRRGPWAWLLAIALGGVLIAGGLIYYYLTYMKPPGQANNGVPMIEAPEQGAKTVPETQGGTLSGTQGTQQPPGRKEIYDRILGDDEVGGNQVVPTQEQPQTIEPTGDNEGQGAAPIPNSGSGTQDNSAEPLPLPLPPPGEQGNNLPANQSQQTAALGAVNQDTAPQPEPASSTADTGAPVPGQLAKASEEIASSPPPTVEQPAQPAAEQPAVQQPAVEQITSEPEPLPVKPAKQKVKAEKKAVQKVAAIQEDQQGGVEPLVLVPPAQPVNNQPQVANNQITVAEPDALQQQNVENAATEQKSKSFFNFGTTGKRKLTGKAAESADARGTGTSGNWANSPDPNKVAADTQPQQEPPQPQQQVASIAPEPEPMPAPEPQQPAKQAKPSGSGGFVAQLASFRSEAEAMAEYDRLRAKHGGVLNGLSPRVVKATVAGAARYRLAVGPMASRDAASKVCNSLIAAGERDCLVRGN